MNERMAGSGIMLSVLWITIAFGLLLLNAFFVAAEFGMVKLRHTRLEVVEDIYGLRGKILAKVHKNLDAYLSACQLGITLASLGLGWIGEPAFSALLEPAFESMGVVSPNMVKFLSFFIAFSLLSFLHIVIGELMPKSLAIRQAEKVSVWTALPLYGFYWLMFPAIWVLNSCSNFFLKLVKLDRTHKGELFYSTDEIKLILNSSHSHGELSKEETEILEHTLDFAELRVTDVMRPIEDMIGLNINQSIQDFFKLAIETRYSRYVVTDEAQNILGIVHVKDLLDVLYRQKENVTLKELMRPILKVSSRLPAIDLLRRFREGMPHFAVVYQGSETPIGFVTLDNLLHILVGRIKDEFHRTKDDWIATGDGGYIVKGNHPLYTIERLLDIDILTEDETSTIYGLIVDKLGRLPTVGERIEFEDFTAEIAAMKGAKILEVKIYPK